MIKGKGFRGALRYNLEKVAKGVAEVLDHSFVNVSEKTILKEIQMVKVLRPNLRKYFYHTSINFPPSENLSNALMLQIGQDYLRESGFTQHQYIMFRHQDASHPHLHILVNRIGYDGKVLSDSNDFANCEKILRGLEKKYNLTKVISSKQAVKRAVTKDELEMMKRTQSPSYKVQLHKIIKDVLSIKPDISCSEFIQALQKKHVNVRFNIASTGYVSGISYSYKDMIVTGSKLGNDFKWTTLRNSLDYQLERDRTIILQANARTTSNPSHTLTGSIYNRGNATTVLDRSGQHKATGGQPETTRHPDQERAKTGGRTKHTDQFAKAKADRNDYPSAPNADTFSLASLLDGDSHRDTCYDNHQSFLNYESVKKRRRKRKRRRRL